MIAVKQKMLDLIQDQPEDSSYDEIMRELAFERMVDQGLADSREGRVISNNEMLKKMDSWQK
jgi:predicted transcriptional regulator